MCEWALKSLQAISVLFASKLHACVAKRFMLGFLSRGIPGHILGGGGNWFLYNMTHFKAEFIES